MYLHCSRNLFSSVIAHTVAKRILDDIEQRQLKNLDEKKLGGNGLIALAQSRQIRSVSYDDWKRLDAYETNLGSKRGKPREKIIDLNQMLEITSTTKN